jgi:ECF transporter S component (folate family)
VNRARTLKLVYIAVFVALSVVLRTFAIWGSSRITFDYIPIILSGVFLGPVAGLVTGSVADVLAFLIRPMGAWNPAFLGINALVGLLPGLVFKFLKVVKNDYIKLSIAVSLIFVSITLFLNPLAVYFFFVPVANRAAFGTWYIARLPVQSIVFLANAIVIFAAYPPMKQLKTATIINHEI